MEDENNNSRSIFLGLILLLVPSIVKIYQEYQIGNGLVQAL